VIFAERKSPDLVAMAEMTPASWQNTQRCWRRRRRPQPPGEKNPEQLDQRVLLVLFHRNFSVN